MAVKRPVACIANRRTEAFIPAFIPRFVCLRYAGYAIMKASACAEKTVQSGMRFRRAEVNMGLRGFSEYEIYQTDESEVKRAKALLELVAGGSI